MLITPEKLRKIVENLSLERASTISGLINEICPKYGINSKDILEEFLATLAHESGGFRLKSENLNYTRPELIVKTWATRFNVQTAAPLVRNPRLLANKVYNGRMGNRNGTDDGFVFRGAGFIQATGRDMFEKMKAYFKYAGTPEQLADLIRTDDKWAMESACYIFAVDKQLIDEAMDDKFETVTRRINGGLIGWADRQKYLALCKQFL
jgi:putative chitinase